MDWALSAFRRKKRWRKREREWASAIVICQEFSYTDRGLKNIRQVTSECMVIRDAVKSTSQPGMFWRSRLWAPPGCPGWRTTASSGTAVLEVIQVGKPETWEQNVLHKHLSAVDGYLLNLKCPFHGNVGALSNPPILREYFRARSEEASQGKGFSSLSTLYQINLTLKTWSKMSER